MSGTIVFRPKQANFDCDNKPGCKIDQYIEFKVGWHSAKTCVAEQEDRCVEWNQEIKLKKSSGQHFAQIKIKEKEKYLFDGVIGKAKINMDLVVNKGKVLGWYHVYHKKKQVGELLIEVEYQPIEVRN